MSRNGKPTSSIPVCPENQKVAREKSYPMWNTCEDYCLSALLHCSLDLCLKLGEILFMQLFSCLHTDRCVHACRHAHACMHACRHMYTRTHTWAHTHTHIHTGEEERDHGWSNIMLTSWVYYCDIILMIAAVEHCSPTVHTALCWLSILAAVRESNIMSLRLEGILDQFVWTLT